VDNIKNECKGSARISIRSNSPNERGKVQEYLKKKGYSVKEVDDKHEKPQNYLDTQGTSWINPGTAIETLKSKRTLNHRDDDRWTS